MLVVEGGGKEVDHVDCKLSGAERIHLVVEARVQTMWAAFSRVSLQYEKVYFYGADGGDFGCLYVVATLPRSPRSNVGANVCLVHYFIWPSWRVDNKLYLSSLQVQKR